MLSVTVRLLAVASLVFGLPENYKLPELKNGGEHWAVLVAGSNSWINYRHQADVCHAYQIMKRHGLPDERIIVMMVDDIAENKLNPVKGEIINQPDGENVYEGVVKDYTGLDEVTPEVFLDVIQGNKEKLAGIGSGKVLQSGPNDNVFINFVDHGAPGLIAFGRKFLHAIDLNIALDRMHDNNQFNKILIYLETCESGSMFKSLLRKDFNVLAVTAANSTQSSYACYFDKKRRTYLGDLFSVNWMQNSDKNDMSKETIDEQYHVVKKETNRSHVMEFGSLTMNDLMLSDFMGSKQVKPLDIDIPDPNLDAVPSEDVDISIQKHLYKMAESEEEKKEIMSNIETILEKRSRIDNIMKHIVSMSVSGSLKEQNRILMGENELVMHDCYKIVVENLKDRCKEMELPFNGYALKQLRTLVNLCERPFSPDTINSAINKVCDVE